MDNPTNTLPRRYRPTLFIGLGGAGGQIVNRIAGQLANSADWDDVGGIFQFFVLDTDKKDLEKWTNVPEEHRTLTKGFDIGAYAAQKRGRVEAVAPKPDPQFVQWAHPWYDFRTSVGHGAGQIRLESRLCIHHEFESEQLSGKLKTALNKAKGVRSMNLQDDPGLLRVFMYFSVAGGTGSGSNLPVAYMVRQLASVCNLTAQVYGIALLPTLFTDATANSSTQEDAVYCNGYAALKETEHLMQLHLTRDARDPGNYRRFVFDPRTKKQERVEEPPYDFLYLIDRGGEVDVARGFREAAADAMFLQLHTPIFAVRNADFDNYEKSVKHYASGLYTRFYGSFGCAALVVPDRDILEYCALRQASEVFGSYFRTAHMASDGRYFPSVAEREGWESLDEGLRKRLEDVAFVRFALHEHELQAQGGGGGGVLGQMAPLFSVTGLSPERLPRLEDLLDPKARASLVARAVREFENLETLHRLPPPDPLFPRAAGDLTASAAARVAAEVMYDTDRVGAEGEDAVDDDFTLVYKGWRTVGEERLLGADGWLHRLEVALGPPEVPACPSQPERRANPAVVEDRIVEDAKRIRAWAEGLGGAVSGVEKKAKNAFGSTRSLLGWVRTGHGDPEEDLHSLRLYFTVLREELLFLREVAQTVGRQRGLTPEGLDRVRKRLEALCDRDLEALGEGRDQRLRDEARVEVLESLASHLPGGHDEQETFRECWQADFLEVREAWLETLRSYHYLDGLRRLGDTLLEPIGRFLDTLRAFNPVATLMREDLERDVERYLSLAGEEANRFVLDVEVLQDLGGHRQWDRYYDTFIARPYRLPQREVLGLLTDVFLDDQLAGNPHDIAAVLRERLVGSSKRRLHDVIVGRHSVGERHRLGLLVDDGLRIEAELDYVRELVDQRRFDDLAATYERYRSDPSSEVPQVAAFREDLERHTKGYLERKIDHCARLSSVLANIDDNADIDVAQGVCRQDLVVYPHALYGPPNEEDGELHFPTVIARHGKGFAAVDWAAPEASKRVVFYQAVLGVPLYFYRNVRGDMRARYDRLAGNHDEKSRIYPLHIDRNWEPGEEGIDPLGLPLSLDPAEGAKERKAAEADRWRFAAQVLTLWANGDIVWDRDTGLEVPSGHLALPADRPPEKLGRSLGEAVDNLHGRPALRTLVEETVGDDLLGVERLEALSEEFEKLTTPDPYSGKSAASEADKDTARLLEQVLGWCRGQGPGCGPAPVTSGG